MNILEALDELGAFIDMVTGSGFLSDEELEKIEEVESVIHAYVCEKGDM